MTRCHVPSIAIVKSDFASHAESWEVRWISALEQKAHPYSYVDWRERGAISCLKKHDIVLWAFSHYSPAEKARARDILYALEQAGTLVFPGFSDSWHYDDKIAQSYLFEALGINTPANDVIYSEKAVVAWADEIGDFPVVAKLAGGSGSHNVQLINDREALIRYARRAFGGGFSSRPSVLLKIGSNLRSSRTIAQIWQRAKRAPDFILTLWQTRNLEREKGYVYLQRFVPGARYDLKIAVVNEKLGFIVRDVRKGDFRASGGGSLGYDRNMVTDDVIALAYELYDCMGTICTGMDIVIDPNGKPLIIETSMSFSASAMQGGGGYFDRSGRWHEGALDAPLEILNVLIARFHAKVSAK